MKVGEFRAMSSNELQQELLILLRTQFSLRMQKATQQLTNTNQLCNIRKDIARVRTIITEKTI